MDDLIRVAVVHTEPEADLAVSLLRTEGIRAMWRTTDIGAGALGVGGGGATGPLEVVVLEKDAQRARELLAPTTEA
jgi:hypothetical protein